MEVPIDDREACLGPSGAMAQIEHVLHMLRGKWKLAILFRLYADPALRSSQLLRDMPGVSQKVLTEQLRELEADGLVGRVDFNEQPLRVEYHLTEYGRQLTPLLREARHFAQVDPKTK